MYVTFVLSFYKTILFLAPLKTQFNSEKYYLVFEHSWPKTISITFWRVPRRTSICFFAQIDTAKMVHFLFRKLFWLAENLQRVFSVTRTVVRTIFETEYRTNTLEQFKCQLEQIFGMSKPTETSLKKFCTISKGML